MKENKFFPYLVAISAISISFSAAFYSIFGIGKMFAGASTNVMVMAASLEFAKLVIASLLYRFWEDINKVLRVYLMLACFILIVITSAGIYGFLSSAYQETANKVENIDKNTAVLEKKKQMIQKQLDQAEKQLEFKSNRQNTLSDMRNRQQTNADNLISQNKSASAVRSQMNQLGKESKTLDDDIKVLQDTIASKTKQIGDLDLEILGVSSNNDLANEIGPLKYIAKITGKTLDQVVNWFIIALMLVFDPLAIALVVSANFVFSYTTKKKGGNNDLEKIENEKEIKPETDLVGEEDNVIIVKEETKNESSSDVVQTEDKQNLVFVIGETPLSDLITHEEEIKEEEILEESKEGENQKSDEELVYSPNVPEINPTLTSEEVKAIVEENSPEEMEQNSENDLNNDQEEYVEGDYEEEDDGEFKGYRLGNVYKKGRKNIKDYKDNKDIPIELLKGKEDPTRL